MATGQGLLGKDLGILERREKPDIVFFLSVLGKCYDKMHDTNPINMYVTPLSCVPQAAVR